MKTEFDQKYLENAPKVLEAAASQTFLQSVASTIAKEVEKWNVVSWGHWNHFEPDPIELTPYFRSGELNCSFAVKVDDYDKLMGDPNTIIADTEWITCTRRLYNTLMPQGVECCISLTIKQALPEEDLGTLRMLGKVQREKPSFYEGDERVICTI